MKQPDPFVLICTITLAIVANVSQMAAAADVTHVQSETTIVITEAQLAENKKFHQKHVQPQLNWIANHSYGVKTENVTTKNYGQCHLGSTSEMTGTFETAQEYYHSLSMVYAFRAAYTDVDGVFHDPSKSPEAKNVVDKNLSAISIAVNNQVPICFYETKTVDVSFDDSEIIAAVQPKLKIENTDIITPHAILVNETFAQSGDQQTITSFSGATMAFNGITRLDDSNYFGRLVLSEYATVELDGENFNLYTYDGKPEGLPERSLLDIFHQARKTDKSATSLKDDVEALERLVD